jgi:hypothetical protein
MSIASVYEIETVTASDHVGQQQRFLVIRGRVPERDRQREVEL